MPAVIALAGAVPVMVPNLSWGRGPGILTPSTIKSGFTRLSLVNPLPEAEQGDYAALS